MQPFDVIAVLMLVASAGAFAAGNGALARAEDLVALYWLVTGIVLVRASVQIARSGGRTSGGRT